MNNEATRETSENTGVNTSGRIAGKGMWKARSGRSSQRERVDTSASRLTSEDTSRREATNRSEFAKPSLAPWRFPHTGKEVTHELRLAISDWSSKKVDGVLFDQTFQFEDIPLSWIYLPILYSSLLPPPFATAQDAFRENSEHQPHRIKRILFSRLFRSYLGLSESLKWKLSRAKRHPKPKIGTEHKIPEQKNINQKKVLFLTFTNHLSATGDLFRIHHIIEELKTAGRYQELVLLADPLTRLSMGTLLKTRYRTLYEYYDSATLQQAAEKAQELAGRWKALSLEQKIQLLQYQGTDVFSPLRHNLDFLYSAECIRMTLNFYLTFKRILAQEGIGAIVLSSQNNILEKCLIAAARQQQIPVVVIQHGTGLGTLKSINTPTQVKFAVFGPYYQQRLMELGVASKNIKITGPIIFDGIEPYCTAKRGEPSLLLMTSPLVEDRILSAELYFERVRLVLRNLKPLNLPLKIRLHLRERNVRHYLKIIAEEGLSAELITDNSRKKHYALIEQCSVLLNFGSTTALEAMIIGRPTLTINLFDGLIPMNTMIFDSGATTVCSYHEPLAPLIKALLQHNPWQKQAQHFIRHLCDRIDGQSSRRIVEYIHQEISFRERRPAVRREAVTRESGS